MLSGNPRYWVLVPVIALLLSGRIACANAEEVVVAVTHQSLKAVVEAVGGDRVRVLVLVPPGVDPHHYEPSAHEVMALLKDTRVVLITGPSHLPIEMKIEELHGLGLYSWILLTYQDYASEGLELLINPATGGINPHGYFLSLRGLKAIARSLYKVLTSIDPEGAGYYEARLQGYLSYLQRLNESLKDIVENIKAVRAGLVTPLLHYASVDAGLEVRYLVVAEHSIPIESKDVLNAIDGYEKHYDVLIVSDTELVEYQQAIKELARRGVRLAIIPLSALAQESPELVPLAIALSLSSPQIEVIYGNEPNPLPYFYSILIASAVSLVVLLVYTIRLRGYEVSK